MYNLSAEDWNIGQSFDEVMYNDGNAHRQLSDACWLSVINDEAATNDVEDAYRMAYRDHDGNWLTFVDCARLSLIDTFIDMVDSQMGQGTIRDLFLQVMDIHNRDLWWEITECFMPDPDDVFGEDN